MLLLKRIVLRAQRNSWWDVCYNLHNMTFTTWTAVNVGAQPECMFCIHLQHFASMKATLWLLL